MLDMSAGPDKSDLTCSLGDNEILARAAISTVEEIFPDEGIRSSLIRTILGEAGKRAESLPRDHEIHGRILEMERKIEELEAQNS